MADESEERARAGHHRAVAGAVHDGLHDHHCGRASSLCGQGLSG